MPVVRWSNHFNPQSVQSANQVIRQLKNVLADVRELLPLVKNLKQRHPALVEQAQELSADKGYESEPNNRKLWRDHRVKPLIDIRSMWKEKETRLIDDTRADNIVYDETGQIYCHCPLTDEPREMAY